MTNAETLLQASRTEASAGRLREALDLAILASEAAPDDTGAVGECGALLASLGRFAEARPLLERALAGRPAAPELWNNLGAALRGLGRTPEALNAFVRALTLKPDYREAATNIAASLEAEPLNAMLAARLAAQLEPLAAGQIESAELLFVYGWSLWSAQRTQEAIPHFERAIALDPKFADARHMLAAALIEIGSLDAARSALTEAISLDPDRAQSYRLIASIDAGAIEDKAIARLEELTQAAAPVRRSEAHFALAQALRRRGDLRSSFAHLIAANREQLTQSPYDERPALASFEAIEQTFTAQLLADRALTHPTARPIFIFGMPRSGTTLVEQIVASHPEVYAGGELTLLDDITADEIHVKGALSRAIAERYDEAIAALAPGPERRVTDKLPANFRYAGLIFMMMPRAIMIHVRRDPLDTCLSCFAQTFASSEMGWSCDLATTGHYYRGYARLMEHWRAVLPADAMLEVRYEDLIADFETHARRIIEYCRLDWDERSLTFHQTQRPVRTASATQVRRPIYATSVRASREYGDLLLPLREALGEYNPPD